MQGKLGSGVIISGFVARDAESKVVGQKSSTLTNFSIAADKREKEGEQETVWVNCKAWHDLGRYAARIHKGDHVLVTGKIESNTDDSGKVWRSVNCDFISICPTSGTQQTVPSASSAIVDNAEVFDDDGVPF